MNRWPSQVAAASGTGGCRKSISKVCCGKARTAGGFRWRFVSSPDSVAEEGDHEADEHPVEADGADDEDRKPFVRRAVEQLNAETGAVMNRWPSQVAAASGTGGCRKSISKVCCGKARTSGGFRWRFVSSADSAQGDDDDEGGAAADDSAVEESAAAPKHDADAATCGGGGCGGVNGTSSAADDAVASVEGLVGHTVSQLQVSTNTNGIS